MNTYIQTKENVLERFVPETKMRLELVFNSDPNAESDEEIENKMVEKLKKMYLHYLSKK